MLPETMNRGLRSCVSIRPPAIVMLLLLGTLLSACGGTGSAPAPNADPGEWLRSLSEIDPLFVSMQANSSGLYIGGKEHGYGTAFNLILHSNLSGDFDWALKLPGPDNGSVGWPLLCLAPGGDVISCMTQWDYDLDHSTLQISRVSSAGRQVWQRELALPEQDSYEDIIVSSRCFRGRFIVGYSASQPYPARGSSLRLLCLDQDGALIWSRDYSLGADHAFNGYGVRVDFDEQGSTYVAGAAGRGLAVLALDQQGEPRWARYLGLPPLGDDPATCAITSLSLSSGPEPQLWLGGKRDYTIWDGFDPLISRQPELFALDSSGELICARTASGSYGSIELIEAVDGGARCVGDVYTRGDAVSPRGLWYATFDNTGAMTSSDFRQRAAARPAVWCSAWSGEDAILFGGSIGTVDSAKPEIQDTEWVSDGIVLDDLDVDLQELTASYVPLALSLEAIEPNAAAIDVALAEPATELSAFCRLTLPQATVPVR